MKRNADPHTAGLTGVVLCGGQSSRMGRDKGLLEWDGVCWAARMGRKLAPFGLPVVYSIREGQEEAYSAVLPDGCLIEDAMDIGGPLNGLLSVHRRFPGSDLFLLACDMQDMDEETIGELVGFYRFDRGFDCYVYEEGGFVQPFCAIYTGEWLAKATLEMGEDRSLRSVIGKGNVRRLAIKSGKAFENYNSF